jgi:hypothetical protein
MPDWRRLASPFQPGDAGGIAKQDAARLAVRTRPPLPRMITMALSVSNDNPLCRRLGVNRSRPPASLDHHSE